MSHISQVEREELYKLDLIEETCRKMGLQFMRGQTTFQGYYSNVSNQCHHAIKIPGTRYEIGVVAEGEGYRLQADFYDHTLRDKIGRDCKKFNRHYDELKVRRAATRRRCRVIDIEDERPGWERLRIEI